MPMHLFAEIQEYEIVSYETINQSELKIRLGECLAHMQQPG